ncbi:MAG: hypothetical protein Q9222_004593 [Ikaeria aurantiellina]
MLHIAPTILYYSSIAIIAATTLPITVLMGIIAHAPPRLPHQPGFLQVYILSHRLQTIFMVLNILNAIILLISFPIVVHNLSTVCHTGLAASDCNDIRHTWHAIAIALVVISGLLLANCWSIYRYVFCSRRLPSRRQRAIRCNKPMASYVSHLLFQCSAIATLGAAYSYTVIAPDDLQGAFRIATVHGALAIAFFDAAVVLGYWGIMKHTFTLKNTQDEAGSRGFRIAVSWFNWLGGRRAEVEMGIFFAEVFGDGESPERWTDS